MGDDVVGRAWYELGARNDKLDRDLKNAEQQVTRSGQAGATSFEKSYATAGQNVVRGLGKVTAALAAVGLAVGISTGVQFLESAVTAASDLAETTSKANIVFGDASEAVLKLGSDSATALGMSENAALAAAGTYGNLFRAMGIAEETSADMSVRLVQLAADLASFNNMDPTEVLDKLRAGLSGESEPLRTLGINLSAARIQAEAMKMGLAGANGELTAAAKAQATYSLILQDTALAQGDFERTGDGLANQQRILLAQWENMQASLGKRLLPVVLQLTSAVNDGLTPALEDAGPAFDFLGASLGNFIKQVEGVMALGFLIPSTLGAISGSAKSAAVDTAAAVREGISATEAALSADRLVGPARQFFQPIYGEAAAARRKAIAEVRALPGDLARALREGQAAVDSGMTELTDLMENSLSDAAKIAHLKGVLASQELAAGLTDERADVRAAALAVQQDALEQLQLLESGAADAAVDAGTTFAEQLRLQRVAAGNAGRDVAREAIGAIEGVDGGPPGQRLGGEVVTGFNSIDGKAAGDVLAKEFADGLSSPSALAYTRRRAMVLAGAASGPLKGESPPKEGPLRDIDKWGFNVGRSWADNLVRGANLNGLLAGLGGIGAITGGGAMAGGGGGAVPPAMPGTSGQVFNLHFAGRESSVDSAWAAIDELSRLGVFSDGRFG